MYRTYHNARFDFTVSYPADLLIPQGETQNSDGQRFVYSPAVAPDAAQHRALRDLVRTFFKGDPGPAAVALVSEAQGSLSEDDLDRLSELIESARREGR